MSKTRIASLSYNAMFKAVFSNNKVILTRLIEAILKYCKIDINLQDKELVIKNNELPLDNRKDKQLICDYIIKIDEEHDLNIEINRASYIGLMERNMAYGFKIFYNHFKRGNKYSEFKRYNLLQVNFNEFPNPNNRPINRYFLIDAEDLANILSNNISILNIDIVSCYKLVYNSSNKEEISDLERLSAILHCKYLEDISNILGSDMLDMKEKRKLLKEIEKKSSDKDIEEDLSFEDNMQYRFKLVEEDALERGKEEALIETIKSMLKKNISLQDISDITGKSIEEIKKMKDSLKD